MTAGPFSKNGSMILFPKRYRTYCLIGAGGFFSRTLFANRLEALRVAIGSPISLYSKKSSGRPLMACIVSKCHLKAQCCMNKGFNTSSPCNVGFALVQDRPEDPGEFANHDRFFEIFDDPDGERFFLVDGFAEPGAENDRLVGGHLENSF